MLETSLQRVGAPTGHQGTSMFQALQGREGVSDLLIWYPLLEDESDQFWMGIP